MTLLIPATWRLNELLAAQYLNGRPLPSNSGACVDSTSLYVHVYIYSIDLHSLVLLLTSGSQNVTDCERPHFIFSTMKQKYVKCICMQTVISCTAAYRHLAPASTRIENNIHGADGAERKMISNGVNCWSETKTRHNTYTN